MVKLERIFRHPDPPRAEKDLSKPCAVRQTDSSPRCGGTQNDGNHIQMRKFYYFNFVHFFLILLIFFFILSPAIVMANHTPHIFPKRANYFLHWSITEQTARELSKWDLVILDMETQINSRPQLLLLRQLNPNIKLLAYITSEEIKRDAPISVSRLRQKLSARIDPRWYAVSSVGQRLSFWPGTDLLNMSADAPAVDGKKMNKVMAEFVATELLSTGLWDGVFYDNAFDSVTWFAGPDVDFNLDGVSDPNPDAAWKEGMKYLYDETRRITGGKYLVVGNGTTRAYRDNLNGQMVENFLPGSWTPTMQTYQYFHDGGPAPRLNIINANTANRGSDRDYRAMRFGLTSALLSDGYFSFDFGDQNHGQLWYYDEYNIDLGTGNGAAKSFNGGKNYSADVWQRDFDHGIAVVNSSNRTQEVTLAGEYEKIRGAQDAAVNNGRIVSTASVPAYDGLILLKTFATLDDVPFVNGNFARFLSPTGATVRNGFFVFDSAYGADAEIARIDLDKNGRRDLILAEGNRLLAWRDDGQPLLRLYPYGASFAGSVRFAVGDIEGDGALEVISAPRHGGAPVKVFDRYGNLLINNWYPVSAKFAGGLSVAIGDVSGDNKGEIIIGYGKGTTPKVAVYRLSSTFQPLMVKQWLAFEKSFRGGVFVAVGNVDGAGKKEVIVGAGPGKLPLIRVYAGDGKELYQPFSAYTSLDTPGVEVAALDVNFDGKDDIAAFASGL